MDDIRQERQGQMANLRDQLRQGQISGNDYREAISRHEVALAQVVRTLKQSPEFRAVPLTAAERQAKYGPDYKESGHPVDQFIDAYYALTELTLDKQTDTVDVEQLMALRAALVKATPDDVVRAGLEYINRNKDPEYLKAQEVMREIMAIPRFGHQGVTAARSRELESALRQFYAVRDLLHDQYGGRSIAQNQALSALQQRQGPEVAQLAYEGLKRASYPPNPARTRLRQQNAALLQRFYGDLLMAEEPAPAALPAAPALAGVP